MRIQPAAVDVRVAGDSCKRAIANCLTSAGQLDTVADGRRGFSPGVIGEHPQRDGGHADGHVDAIGQRSGNARLVARDIGR
jgi:hypothetical protein